MTYAETSKRPLRPLRYSETTVTELQRRIDELKRENETLRARLRNAPNKLGLQ